MVEYCVQPTKKLKQVLYTKSAYRFESRPYVTDCPAQGSHHIRADCDPIAQAAMRKQAAREWSNIAFNPPKTKSKFCTPHVRTNLGQDLTLRIVPPNARIIQRPLATSAVSAGGIGKRDYCIPAAIAAEVTFAMATVARQL